MSESLNMVGVKSHVAAEGEQVTVSSEAGRKGDTEPTLAQAPRRETAGRNVREPRCSIMRHTAAMR